MCAKRAQAEARPPGAFLKWFGVVSSFGMFMVNFIGFLDTQTGSAEGCGPDWPLCNGQVLPTFNNAHVIIEFLHRALVGGFAVIAFVFTIWAYVRYKEWIEVKVFAAVSVGFVVIQSILGAIAVVFVNPPEVLALHLGFGLMAMGAVFLLTVFLWQYDAMLHGKQSGLALRKKMPSRSLISLIWIVWIYTYGAIYWGSYVAFRDAATGCKGWPLCNGEIFPGFSGNAGLAFVHRLAALGLAALVLVLLFRLAKTRSERPDLYRAAQWLLVFVVIQIATGAWVILTNISLNADLAHVANIMVVFSVLSYLLLETFPFRQPRSGNSSH